MIRFYNDVVIYLQAIPFRTLETFSSEEIVPRYIVDPQIRQAYLEDIYNYLVKRKYFKLVRQLLEEKVPPLYDVVLSPPNSMSETLLHMIQHPLKLLTASNLMSSSATTASIGNNCVELIISSFVDEILVPEFSPPIQLFIIPCLANQSEFPFLHLLKYFSELITIVNNYEMEEAYNVDAHQPLVINDIVRDAIKKAKSFGSSFLFNAFLHLDQLQFQLITSNSQYIRCYIQVLAKMSNNIRKLPRRSAAAMLRNSDDTMDDDADDIDSDSDSDYRGRGMPKKTATISILERDCLLEAISQLNEQERAELIVDSVELFLDDSDVLFSLCKICHNLMLYHRSALFEYK